MVSLFLFSLNTFGAEYTGDSGVLNCRISGTSQRQHVSYKSYIIEGSISDYVDLFAVNVDHGGIASGKIKRSFLSRVYYDSSREIVDISFRDGSAALVECR